MRVTRTGVCKVCGVSFSYESGTFAPSRKYCSDDCRRKVRYHKRADYREDYFLRHGYYPGQVMPEKCKVCGRPTLRKSHLCPEHWKIYGHLYVKNEKKGGENMEQFETIADIQSSVESKPYVEPTKEEKEKERKRNYMREYMKKWKAKKNGKVKVKVATKKPKQKDESNTHQLDGMKQTIEVKIRSVDAQIAELLDTKRRLEKMRDIIR